MIKPRVGILIPTYNRAEYLREALDSVLGQSYTALHIIVIDNGSTDATSAYMQSIADPRVRYVVNEENLGPIGSINKGIDLMPEDVSWCTVLCDDDLLGINFLEKMLAFITCHPGMGVAYAPLSFIDSNGTPVRDGVRGPERENPLSYLKARSHNRRETYLSGVFFSRKLFDLIGGYPDFSTGMATDDAFIFHLGASGGVVGCNWSAKVYIRLHEGSVSVALTGGFNRHFRSLLEFHSYCCNVARAYGFDEKDVTRWITHKIKLWLNSELIKAIRASIEDRSGSRKVAALDGLHEVLGALEGYLSLRFRTDLYLYERFNIFLEKYKWYFAIWRIIKN